jgi:hypothetical protein
MAFSARFMTQNYCFVVIDVFIDVAIYGFMRTYASNAPAVFKGARDSRDIPAGLTKHNKHVRCIMMIVYL